MASYGGAVENDTEQSFYIDLTSYKYITYSLEYYNGVCDQVTLPKSGINITIRTLSAFIDTPENIAIVKFSISGTSATIHIFKNINNGVYGKIYGIK